MEFTVIPNEQTPKIDKIQHELVSEYIEKHKEEFSEFLKYAKTRKDAVGLAANQTALDGERFGLRAFALRSMIINDWKLIINPEIVEQLGLKDIKVEGCLTWKNKVIVAERSRSVKVKYYDMKGQQHIGIFKGFVGQIWQHEINHLEGIEEKVMDYYDEPKPIKVQRNEPCPCGSGKKYKNCCNSFS